MKVFRVFSAFFVFLFLQIAIAALLICFSPISARPILLLPSQDAVKQAEAMMDAICMGDYTAAEDYLLGQPSLGADRPATEGTASLFWNAFTESLSYQLQGPCFATDSGLAQDITVTYLDIGTTSASLRQRAEYLLEDLLSSSVDTADIYDGNNNYREDVIMQVLYTAAENALAEDAAYCTVTVTVNMIYKDGQWWIVPDAALLGAISGGIIR